MAGVMRRKTASKVSGDDIVIEAAWLYYHDNLNQGEIASRLNVSRATVVNYLQEARERGLVRISLDPSAFLGHQLAHELCERFGLKAAYVVPSGDQDEETAFFRVAAGAAQWLPALLEAGDTLGVAWGRTIFEMAEALVDQAPTQNLRVVQLVGSMATPYGFTSEICSTHLADRLGARCINLHAPAILTSAELAGRLRAEPIIKMQMEALNECNKVVFAAGACNRDSHIVGSGIATPEEVEIYMAKGAVGVLCGRFIDAEGRSVAGPLDERMIGVSLDRIRGLAMGLMVSVGADKVEPMRAVMRGGYATHLVTNSETAEALLAG